MHDNPYRSVKKTGFDHVMLMKMFNAKPSSPIVLLEAHIHVYSSSAYAATGQGCVYKSRCRECENNASGIKKSRQQHQNEIRQRQETTRTDQTRQEKTRPHKTRRDITRRDEIKQDKTRAGKTG